MTHSVLNRILMLDHMADERFCQHQRRSTSAAAVAGTLTLFALARIPPARRAPRPLGSDLGDLRHGRNKNRPHALVPLQKLTSLQGVIPCACLTVNSIPNPAAFTPLETFASLPAIALTIFRGGFAHRHPALYDGLRFLFIGLAIGLLYWSARRCGGCASHS